jgi:hypothetical protein
LRARLGQLGLARSAIGRSCGALGEDKLREATALELIPGLVGSPIYRER